MHPAPSPSDIATIFFVPSPPSLAWATLSSYLSSQESLVPSLSITPYGMSSWLLGRMGLSAGRRRSAWTPCLQFPDILDKTAMSGCRTLSSLKWLPQDSNSNHLRPFVTLFVVSISPAISSFPEVSGKCHWISLSHHLSVQTMGLFIPVRTLGEVGTSPRISLYLSLLGSLA